MDRTVDAAVLWSQLRVGDGVRDVRVADASRTAISASAPGAGGTASRRTMQEHLLATIGKHVVTKRSDEPSLSRRVHRAVINAGTDVMPILSAADRLETASAIPRTPRTREQLSL